MNCQTCGAKNDADALFCAECGTPLENQDMEATIAGQIIDVSAGDDDKTIMSTAEDLAAEAKTMAVDQAQIADAMAEDALPAADTSDPFAPDSLDLDFDFDKPQPATGTDNPFDPASLGPPPVPAPSAGQTPAPAEPPSFVEDAAPAEIPVEAPAAEELTVEESSEGGSKKMMWIIIGGVVLFLLLVCCCCGAIGVGGILGNPDIMNEFSSVPDQILAM